MIPTYKQGINSAAGDQKNYFIIAKTWKSSTTRLVTADVGNVRMKMGNTHSAGRSRREQTPPDGYRGTPPSLCLMPPQKLDEASDWTCTCVKRQCLVLESWECEAKMVMGNKQTFFISSQPVNIKGKPLDKYVKLYSVDGSDPTIVITPGGSHVTEEKQHTLTSLRKSSPTPRQHYLHRNTHHRILIRAPIWTRSLKSTFC